MRRGLGVDRPVVEHGQTVFARQGERFIALRERRRDQAAGEAVCEGDRTSENGTHRRQPRAAEEPAAAERIDLATPEHAIRRHRIARVEFMDAGLLLHQLAPSRGSR